MNDSIEYNGKQVKIFLKNGMTCEGVVVSWAAEQVILSSLSSSDELLVIYNLKENVVMVKICAETYNSIFDKYNSTSLSPSGQAIWNRYEQELTQPKEELGNVDAQKLEEKYCEATESPAEIDDANLKLKRLAELHDLKKKELAKTFSDKIEYNKIDHLQQVPYATPNFTQRRFIIDSATKTGRGT